MCSSPRPQHHQCVSLTKVVQTRLADDRPKLRPDPGLYSDGYGALSQASLRAGWSALGQTCGGKKI